MDIYDIAMYIVTFGGYTILGFIVGLFVLIFGFWGNDAAIKPILMGFILLSWVFWADRQGYLYIPVDIPEPATYTQENNDV